MSTREERIEALLRVTDMPDPLNLLTWQVDGRIPTLAEFRLLNDLTDQDIDDAIGLERLAHRARRDHEQQPDKGIDLMESTKLYMTEGDNDYAFPHVFRHSVDCGHRRPPVVDRRPRDASERDLDDQRRSAADNVRARSTAFTSRPDRARRASSQSSASWLRLRTLAARGASAS